MSQRAATRDMQLVNSSFQTAGYLTSEDLDHNNGLSFRTTLVHYHSFIKFVSCPDSTSYAGHMYRLMTSSNRITTETHMPFHIIYTWKCLHAII